MIKHDIELAEMISLKVVELFKLEDSPPFSELRAFLNESDAFKSVKLSMLIILKTYAKLTPDEALYLQRYLCDYAIVGASSRTIHEAQHRAKKITTVYFAGNHDLAASILCDYRRYRLNIYLVSKLFFIFDEDEMGMLEHFQRALMKGQKK